MLVDHLTKFLRIAVNLLFLRYPVRTSMGILFGSLAGTMVSAFRPVLSNFTWIDFSVLTTPKLALAGVFGFNIPSLRNRNGLDEATEEKLKAIRIAIKEGNLTNAHARMLYQSFAMQVLAQAKVERSDAKSKKSAKKVNAD